jgi:hypothetical protein
VVGVVIVYGLYARGESSTFDTQRTILHGKVYHTRGQAEEAMPQFRSRCSGSTDPVRKLADLEAETVDIKVIELELVEIKEST